MEKGLDFKRDLSNISRTKESAIKEAEKMMNSMGGNWCVVRLGDQYWAVHEKYLTTHNIKAVKKIKSIYAAPKEIWYKRLAIIPIKLLTRLLRWLAIRIR